MVARHDLTTDKHDLTKQLDAVLDAIRAKANSISPTDVAEASGTSRSTLWGFINKRQNVSVSVIKKWTTYLDGVDLRGDG